MSSPPDPRRSTWNESVDKLKNRLSVLSQSSMDDGDINTHSDTNTNGEENDRARSRGMDNDVESNHAPGSGVGREGTNTPRRSEFDLAREEVERSDEMRYDCTFSPSPLVPFLF